ncbi:hypothetical protein NEIMUCOT_06049 [Neisseria mucosa ATCC 25996]|uniref:Uncharacterized protein n=1 Tax=Neisseria mucosa (strain ATCC 25996 / DSM 4631 / NCTC 10774 / M26) TaxID=546266 RepID=D2ZZH2_NEIM2|nr:hypothetical protein NEIMUCOT_06049 [Neisseria mucosa ATCC 25996]
MFHVLHAPAHQKYQTSKNQILMETLGRSLPYAVQNGRHKGGCFSGI